MHADTFNYFLEIQYQSTNMDVPIKIIKCIKFEKSVSCLRLNRSINQKIIWLSHCYSSGLSSNITILNPNNIPRPRPRMYVCPTDFNKQR